MDSNYALIERGESKEYAVIYGLVPESERRYEGSDWNRTVNYASHTLIGLAKMIDVFRCKTEDKYISHLRLEELATLFKDGLIEDDKESAMEYFEDTCSMDENEMEFFGIGDNEE